MTVKSHRLGPGSLKLGAVGSEVEFAASCTKCSVEPDSKDGDVIPVLSGDELDEGDEDTYTLKASVLQDYDLKSLIVWSHVNAGAVVPFTFRPDNDRALGVKGEVKVKRLSIGGDVKKRNESDLEWPGRNGMYDLIDAASPGTPVIDAYNVAAADSPVNPGDEWA